MHRISKSLKTNEFNLKVYESHSKIFLEANILIIIKINIKLFLEYDILYEKIA
jgi:hypothetical protein